MLNLAKRKLKQILKGLSKEIATDTPVLFLEPSCGAVFRDELISLFPQEEEALRLSKLSLSFSEFLADRELPKLSGKALVHGHCHQQAVFGMKSEERVLSELGLDYEILDSGCCGMAGSFGFEKEHYDVSVRIGEQRLFPAVRAADSGTLLISNGFSCREQIEQCTGRRVLHLAQVIQMAIK
jgi:Fe-S oxidoreductase